METFVKQPRDVLDYDVDMANWFAGIPTDEIENVVITITCDSEDPPVLMAGPGVHPPMALIGASPVRFKIWLGDGTPYADYIVTCLVSTEQDRQKEVEFRVKVRDL